MRLKPSRRKKGWPELLAEVAKANAAQLERKKLMVQSEGEEEERIARYIAERDEREAQEQAEKGGWRGEGARGG